jgi:hypothetical protein
MGIILRCFGAVLLVLGACSSPRTQSTLPTPSAKSAQASPSRSPAAAREMRWPAPDDPLARTRAAGLTPEPREFLINHVHSHLDIFIDGNPVAVPAGIGIDITNPRVRRFEEGGTVGYGGIDPPCETPCISPLHTHDDTGILHTESKTAERNTLGQFFTEWGLTLNDSCLADYCRPAKELKVYVNGSDYGGNPASIPLEDRAEIAIVIGTPPATIPRTADFSQA